MRSARLAVAARVFVLALTTGAAFAGDGGGGGGGDGGGTSPTLDYSPARFPPPPTIFGGYDDRGRVIVDRDPTRGESVGLEAAGGLLEGMLGINTNAPGNSLTTSN